MPFPLVSDAHLVRIIPMDDPAHRIRNAKDPVEWNRRRGRPNSSWLAQLGDHMKEWSMGPAQARAIARDRPKCSRKVSAGSAVAARAPLPALP